MTMQPLNDIVCAEGDGFLQVASHARMLNSRVSNVPAITHSEAVVLYGRSLAVKGQIDRLFLLATQALEEHLAERTLAVLRVENQIEGAVQLFLDIVDEIEAFAADNPMSEKVAVLLVRLHDIAKGWAKAL
jgi:prephenate dehydratase